MCRLICTRARDEKVIVRKVMQDAATVGVTQRQHLRAERFLRLSYFLCPSFLSETLLLEKLSFICLSLFVS